MNLLGIEIGGTKLQLVTGTPDGKILDRQQIAVDRVGGGEGIRARIAASIKQLQKRLDWCAVGVGYGGPVDWRTGRVCCSHHVAGWDDFPLADWLHEQTGLPVVVDNDTNVAAYAEASCGAGMGMNPVFYTNSGSGVGGGCIVNGAIYHGATPGEVELGHLRLDRSGTIVEDCCSGWALDRIVAQAVRTQRGSVLARYAGATTGHPARSLGPALAEGCPVAGGILEVAGDHLAFALSHAVHLFHPEVIVLGGGVSLLGETWRCAVADQLPRYMMQAYQPGPDVRLAALGELAVPHGALLLAAEACGARQAKDTTKLREETSKGFWWRIKDIFRRTRHRDGE